MNGNLLPSISLESTSSCVPITCLFPRKPDFFFFFLHLALCPSHATNSNGLLIPSHMSFFFFFPWIIHLRWWMKGQAESSLAGRRILVGGGWNLFLCIMGYFWHAEKEQIIKIMILALKKLQKTMSFVLFLIAFLSPHLQGSPLSPKSVMQCTWWAFIRNHTQPLFCVFWNFV